jgi:hypothetical protein
MKSAMTLAMSGKPIGRPAAIPGSAAAKAAA